MAPETLVPSAGPELKFHAWNSHFLQCGPPSLPGSPCGWERHEIHHQSVQRDRSPAGRFKKHSVAVCEAFNLGLCHFYRGYSSCQVLDQDPPAVEEKGAHTGGSESWPRWNRWKWSVFGALEVSFPVMWRQMRRVNLSVSRCARSATVSDPMLRFFCLSHAEKYTQHTSICPQTQ